MRQKIQNNQNYIFEAEYLNNVSEINKQFSQLSIALEKNEYFATKFLLGKTYKTFNDEIFSEIKNK